ncbi:hypothetical protein [Kineococcus arenarius]|uniref:hypothetical protein n=1 Tax=Kineococcus sp. SYSU DK007 TaxID=3383128 RepID=UPI003D7C624F
MSYRDAQDRAARLSDPREALEALARAHRGGDDLLARAVAGHAVVNGWSDVVQAWAADRPGAAEQLAELDALLITGSAGITEQLADGAAFYAPRPPELADVMEHQLAQVADPASLAPTPAAAYGVPSR